MNPYTPSIDLVPEMQSNPAFYPPNQSGYNACQYFSCSLSAEAEHRRAGKPIVINRQAGYFMTKEVGYSGGFGNNGAPVDDVSKAWQIFGICTHPTWTDSGNYNQRPPPEVYENAALYKGASVDYMPYIRSGPARDDIIQSIHAHLQRGKLPVAKMRMTASFDNDAGQASNWLQSDWDGSYATGGAGRGDHIVTICGIDLGAKRLLAANHWGENWGDGGFFGVPFDKVLPGPQQCFDIFYLVNNLRVQPVGVPMSHPVPTSLTPDQLAAFEAEVKRKLSGAYAAGGWPGALGTAVFMGLSDKQFEMYAPVLGGLPRYTVRTQVDAGNGLEWPAGMREEQGA